MAFNIKYVYDLVDNISPQLKKIHSNIRVTTMNVRTSANQMASSFDKMKEKLKNVGTESRRIGRSLMLTLTAPVATLGTTSLTAKSSMDSLEATLTSVLAKFDKGTPISQKIGNELSFIKNTANELGVSFKSISDPYVKYLAASKDNLAINRKVIKSFVGMGAALGVGAGDMNRVIRALEQMQSKGQVMAEELKLQLGDVLPGAVGLFAEAQGVSTAQFLEMTQNGEVSSKILSKVADIIQKKYAASIDKGSKTIRANFNRLQNSIFFFRKALGDLLDQELGVNNFLAKLSKLINKVADAINNASPATKKLILVLGGILLVIGPLLLAIGLMIPVFSTMASGAIIVGKAVLFFVSALKALQVVIAANPLGVFLVATALIITYWDELVSIFKTAFDWISKIVSKFDIVAKAKNFFGFGDADVNQNLNANINQRQSPIDVNTSGFMEIIMKGAPAGTRASVIPAEGSALGQSSMFTSRGG